MTTPEQRELAHLRRLVAAYQELHREAWLPVETTWSQVKTGQVVLDKADRGWAVARTAEGITIGSANRIIDPAPAATVRVLAPIPPNLPDLLLTSELGAACARVDEEM